MKIYSAKLAAFTIDENRQNKQKSIPQKFASAKISALKVLMPSLHLGLPDFLINLNG